MSVKIYINRTKMSYEVGGGVNGLAGKLFSAVLNAVRVGEPNIKQIDWGCWHWEMNKSEMIEFLSQDKYKQERYSRIIKYTFPDGSICEYDLCENAFIEEALDFVKKQPDMEDCILVAFDDG